MNVQSVATVLPMSSPATLAGSGAVHAKGRTSHMGAASMVSPIASPAALVADAPGSGRMVTTSLMRRR